MSLAMWSFFFTWPPPPQFVVGSLYIPNYHGIPWKQPGGPGTTVFPLQQNVPFANYPVPGQFFSESSGLFQVGCGHSVDYPAIFHDAIVTGGGQGGYGVGGYGFGGYGVGGGPSSTTPIVLVCCPLCTYIQYTLPTAVFYDLSSNSANPIVII